MTRSLIKGSFVTLIILACLEISEALAYGTLEKNRVPSIEHSELPFAGKMICVQGETSYWYSLFFYR